MASTAPRGRARRGNALTELVILVIPYSLALIGITVIASMGLGRQEAAKAAGWLAANPDARSAEERFFRGFPGELRGQSKIADYAPDVDAENEEPVLPYGDTIAGRQTDLAAAMLRAGLDTRRDEDGTVTITANAVGTLLQDLRLADLGSFTGSFKRGGNLPGANTRYADPSLTAIMAELLGQGGGGGSSGWLGYARVEFESYRYTYGFAIGPGQGARTKAPAWSGGLADTFDVRGLPPDDEEEDGAETSGKREIPPLAAMEMVYRKTDADRGRHDAVQPGSPIRLDRMPLTIYAADDAPTWEGAVDPDWLKRQTPAGYDAIPRDAFHVAWDPAALGG